MIELTVIATSSAIGSAHCLGMCGPFAVLIGHGTESWQANLARQIAYSVGRIATYVFLGAMVGYFGSRMATPAAIWRWAPALVSLAAGLILLHAGLRMMGILRPLVNSDRMIGGVLGKTLKTLLLSPSLLGVFVAGLLTGFLPCGWVYAFLAIAVQTQSILGSILTMAAFGLGTVPAMVTAGCSASLVRSPSRVRWTRIAAICMILAGGVSVARGAMAMPTSPNSDAACPFCSG